MSFLEEIREHIIQILLNLEDGVIRSKVESRRIAVELTPNDKQGDVFTNAAMVLCKKGEQRSDEIAIPLRDGLLKLDFVSEVYIAGPGFVNISLEQSFWHDPIQMMLAKDSRFFCPDIGKKEKINVEFVSANPTGPMHIGHARNAVIGDVIGNVMDRVGFDVVKEYYINDAGRQMNNVLNSILHIWGVYEGDTSGLYPGEYIKDIADYLEQKYTGELYKGINLLPVSSEHDANAADRANIIKDEVVDYIMNLIRRDLEIIRVKFDVFTSEERDLHLDILSKKARAVVDQFRETCGDDGKKFLEGYRNVIANAKLDAAKQSDNLTHDAESDGDAGHTVLKSNDNDISVHKKSAKHPAAPVNNQIMANSNLIDMTIQYLRDKGLVEMGVLPPPKGKLSKNWKSKKQLIFRTKKFGDDSDRVLLRDDKTPVYFASDVAYCKHKIDRGFKKLIMVLGCDHGGYVKRLEAATKAIGGCEVILKVRLQNIVNLYRDGESVKMSKRAGNILSVKDVVDEVGVDSFRYMMLSKKNDTVLDFDFEVVKDMSNNNPVFYVKYAYARAHSILRSLDQQGGESILPETSQLGLLSSDQELSLIKQLSLWPDVLAKVARYLEPHLIATYLYNVSSCFHNLWAAGVHNAEMRITTDDKVLTKARVTLVKAMINVFDEVFSIINIKAEKSM